MLSFRTWDKVNNRYVGMTELYNIRDISNYGQEVTGYSDDSGNAYGKVNEELDIEPFSGCCDINNKPIFVGDIVKVNQVIDEVSYLVIINSFPTRGIYLRNLSRINEGGLQPGPSCMNPNNDYVIVGNYHDNGDANKDLWR